MQEFTALDPKVMKKSIKAELVSLAHKILQLRDTADYGQMASHARELHEKLTVLAYAEKLSATGKPTIGLKEVEEEITANPTGFGIDILPEEEPHLVTKSTHTETPQEATNVESQDSSIHKTSKTPAEILAENQLRFEKARNTGGDRHRPDGTQFNTEEPVHEPVIEKIKDMWPEMTPEAADIDKVIDSIIPQSPDVEKKDSFEIGNEYGNMPIFEPKETAVEEVDDRPKNLNDKLKSGKLKIGLNDKLSFIKHLFNGSSQDYNRVLSQLETFASASEVRQFITTMVKPDYNHWEGKEVQEERFMEIVESRYH